MSGPLARVDFTPLQTLKVKMEMAVLLLGVPFADEDCIPSSLAAPYQFSFASIKNNTIAPYQMLQGVKQLRSSYAA
jgi:hypothetical protein